MLFSAFFLPSLVCGTAFFINFIAIYYHASRAIPFGTMVAVTCICLFVILPLNLVGTVLGRNLAGNPDHPCRYVEKNKYYGVNRTVNTWPNDLLQMKLYHFLN